MVDEKWYDLLDLIDEKFGIEKKEKKDFIFTDDIGNEFTGKIEKIYFNGPMGNIKLERVSKPLIIDKKVHYNRTAGTGARVEYITSETEFSKKVTAYKKGLMQDWEELDLPIGKLNF